MTKLSLTLVAMILTSCASAPLPQNQREFTYVEQTSLKQRDAFNSMLAYLAKNLGDSNLAIKVRDPEAGTIITQIAFDCPELKDFLDPNRHNPMFNLDVSMKDNKIRFVYEGMEDRTYNLMSGALIVSSPISRSSQVTALKTCTERHKAEILKSIAVKRDTNW